MQSISRKHPWIFSGALGDDLSPFAEGEKVHVADDRGNIQATGHFGSGSIAVRLLSFDQSAIDDEYYTGKIQHALSLRRAIGLAGNPDTTAYRLIHGEGDGLPGLVIDIYGNIAVLQAHSKGMVADMVHIKAALHNCFEGEIAHCIEKRADGKREHTPKLPEGAPPGIDILEHGHSFYADWQTGQKTGFFIDQRENRALLGAYAKNQKVLNAFCYSGGFSIYALKGGAREVHSLDSSEKAMKLLERHLETNDLQNAKHQSICTDAMAYLNGEEAPQAAYSIIVLDPPAFAKHRSARHAAVQAYKRLNARAMEIIEPGGMLFTFSCSQVVTPELFNHTIAASAMECGRSVQILHHLHQPADHPVSIFHPEGEYLKGLVLRVD